MGAEERGLIRVGGCWWRGRVAVGGGGGVGNGVRGCRGASFCTIRFAPIEAPGRPYARFAMGIDMYLQWPDMTDDERAAQNTCSLLDGRVGYLRGPKATKVLAPEAFEPVVVPDDVEEDAFWETYLGVPI